MEIAIVILLLTIGGVFGGLLVYAWLSDGRTLRDQFNDMHHSAESVEQRARRVQ